MRAKTIAITALMLGWGAVTPDAVAQKGMGDATGIARQAVKPEVVSLSGTVLEVKTEPCKMTTGLSLVGTHLMLKTEEGEELNIHLGPEADVAHIAKQLVVGQEVTVDGFRTEKMPESAYVAQTLTLDDTTLQLRDENLRPIWAGGRALRGGRSGSQWGAGNSQGRGQGRGTAYGQGRGQGRGAAYGQGRGQGRGAAYGQGRGQGRGAAYGQGRGQGRGAGYGQGRGQGRGAAYGQCPFSRSRYWQ